MYKGDKNYNYKSSRIQKTSIVAHNEKFRRIIIERREGKPYYQIDFFLDGYDDSDAKDFIGLLSKKEILEFVHEYRNIYDPNRIAVYTKDSVRLGYVPKVISSFLVSKLKSKHRIKIYIKNVNIDSNVPDELRIEVRILIKK